MATVCGVWTVAALFSAPSALSQYLYTEFIILGRITYYKHVVIIELLVPVCVCLPSITSRPTDIMWKALVLYPRGTQTPKLNKRRNTAEIVVGLYSCVFDQPCS